MSCAWQGTKTGQEIVAVRSRWRGHREGADFPVPDELSPIAPASARSHAPANCHSYPPGTMGTPVGRFWTCHFLLIRCVPLRDRRLLAGHFARDEPLTAEVLHNAPAKSLISCRVRAQSCQELVTQLQFFEGETEARKVIDMPVIAGPHNPTHARSKSSPWLRATRCPSLLYLNVITLSQECKGD